MLPRASLLGLLLTIVFACSAESRAPLPAIHVDASVTASPHGRGGTSDASPEASICRSLPARSAEGGVPIAPGFLADAWAIQPGPTIMVSTDSGLFRYDRGADRVETLVDDRVSVYRWGGSGERFLYVTTSGRWHAFVDDADVQLSAHDGVDDLGTLLDWGIAFFLVRGTLHVYDLGSGAEVWRVGDVEQLEVLADEVLVVRTAGGSLWGWTPDGPNELSRETDRFWLVGSTHVAWNEGHALLTWSTSATDREILDVTQSAREPPDVRVSDAGWLIWDTGAGTAEARLRAWNADFDEIRDVDDQVSTAWFRSSEAAKFAPSGDLIAYLRVTGELRVYDFAAGHGVTLAQTVERSDFGWPSDSAVLFLVGPRTRSVGTQAMWWWDRDRESFLQFGERTDGILRRSVDDPVSSRGLVLRNWDDATRTYTATIWNLETLERELDVPGVSFACRWRAVSKAGALVFHEQTGSDGSVRSLRFWPTDGSPAPTLARYADLDGACAGPSLYASPDLTRGFVASTPPGGDYRTAVWRGSVVTPLEPTTRATPFAGDQWRVAGYQHSVRGPGHEIGIWDYESATETVVSRCALRFRVPGGPPAPLRDDRLDYLEFADACDVWCPPGDCPEGCDIALNSLDYDSSDMRVDVLHEDVRAKGMWRVGDALLFSAAHPDDDGTVWTYGHFPRVP